MGTRGCYGFRKNGIDKLTYNHYDSYPECLGREMIKFCNETSVKNMNAIYDQIIMVEEESKPTAEQIEICKQWTSLEVSEKSTEDWYCLLRNAQGDLNAYKKGLRYMHDNGRFIEDSLFCEHAYIINLDDNVLEYWKGFQEEPHKENRYGSQYKASKGFDGKVIRYYPCKLVLTLPFDTSEDFAVEQMQEAAQEEEYV